MSAREALMRFIKENEPSYGSNGFYDPETGFGLLGDDEVAAHVNKLLDAYRAEVIAEHRASFTMTEARKIAANHRAEVLREALAAISGERLSDCTGDREDEAYDRGVVDAHRAVMALIYP